MSRTGCEIRGHHDWTVVTDENGWDAVAVTCTDWECAEHRWVEGHIPCSTCDGDNCDCTEMRP